MTGLQTLADHSHRHGVPTETLARWAWHSEPNPRGYTLADASRPYREADGRTVAYPTDGGSEAGQWLRRNPHDLPLGQIAFERDGEKGKAIGPDDIRDPHQTLDLWRGVLESGFTLEGQAVRVTTVAHPDLDLVAVRVESALLATGRLRVGIAFPRGHDLAVKNTPALDWSAPDAHRTTVERRPYSRVNLLRAVDDTRYHVSVEWVGKADLLEPAPHRIALRAQAGTLDFVVGFAPDPLPNRLPTVDETVEASSRRWCYFWRSGAAVDFAGSRDPRAAVLERRLVLSQYLTAVQVGGDFPPQESGLTCSTWYGKHHTEMMWWHTAHFALWGRPERLARQLDWYRARFPGARAWPRAAACAARAGPRWWVPTDARARAETRSSSGTSPTRSSLAELLYRRSRTPATLARYRDLVFETADGLARWCTSIPRGASYVLGPPLWIAQEIHDQRTSQNPSFELAYWRWALGDRAGMARAARASARRNGTTCSRGSHHCR